MIKLLAALLLLSLAPGIAAQPAAPTPPPINPVLVPELFARGAAAIDALRTDAAPTVDLEQAAFDLTAVLYFNPTLSEGYYGRALLAVGRGDLPAAAADIARAVETLPPNDPELAAVVFSFQGQLAQQTGDNEAALTAYTAGIAAAPDAARLYVGRALLYLRQQNPADAVQDLDAALRLDTSDPVVYLYRAAAYARLDRADAPRRAAADYYAFLTGVQTTTTPGGRLISGQPEVIELSAGAVFTFTITGKAGDAWTFRAEARPGDPVDPLLVLLDPDGEPIAADDDSGGPSAANGPDINARIDAFVLPADGIYTVVIGHSLGGTDGLIAVGALLE